MKYEKAKRLVVLSLLSSLLAPAALARQITVKCPTADQLSAWVNKANWSPGAKWIAPIQKKLGQYNFSGALAAQGQLPADTNPHLTFDRINFTNDRSLSVYVYCSYRINNPRLFDAITQSSSIFNFSTNTGFKGLENCKISPTDPMSAICTD